MSEPLWTPSRERVAAANLTRFRESAAARWSEVRDFDDLYSWSVDSPEAFWEHLVDFFGVVHSEPASTVAEDLHQMPGGRTPDGRTPGARFFPGMKLNFAENLLRHEDASQEALVFWNESGHQGSMTYGELRGQVASLAAALREYGIEPGDRIAGFLPNIPQAIIAMLATTSVGAVWSSCSPDFGVKGVVDRFGQIRPRILFTADGYTFGGKSYESLSRVAEVEAEIPEIERVVVVPYLDDQATLILEKCVHWDDFMSRHAGAAPRYEQLPFDHPVYILYSSGTTGQPKCIVHGAGGTVVQHLKELALHTDVKPEDKVFYFTTCGWMMWNWLASNLMLGATAVLYDGSPLKPRAEILWDLAEKEGVTIFGTSAKYLALIEKEGLRPRETHDLSALRTILSTGSPLVPESFDYVYRDVKEDVCLSSISGGTDIISCFAGGNPTAPVYRGELQALGLGMKVEVWNDDGEAVVGEKGELVCTQAFPSMPVGFWNDPDGSKYHHAYFDHYPNVWRHGDWAEMTENGGMIIYGRSDTTLNPGGVRIGTAELYRQVEQFDEVVESIVVGQDWEGDTRIVLFVVLRPGLELDDGLRKRIQRQVRANASPHHVPRRIVQVSDIPRTRSGKITEIAVRDVIHGRAIKNFDALANPEALEQFRDRSELST